MKLPTGRDRDAERVVYGLIAVVALAIIYLVAFVVSNTNSVKVSFVLFDADASLIWVMLACAFLGLVVGAALMQLVAARRAARARGAASTSGPIGATTRPAGGPDGTTQRLPLDKRP